MTNPVRKFFANLRDSANGNPLSLKQRLLWGAMVSLPLFFSLTGFALDRAFQRSLISAEQDNLQGQIYLLLAAAEIDTDQNGNINIWMPDSLLEPRFGQLDSGLYGFIALPGQQPSLWRSASTELNTLDNIDDRQDFKLGTRFNIGTNTFKFSQDVFWDNSQGPLPTRFTVIHSKDRFQGELQAYRDQLWLWLTLAGVGLVIFQLSILHWGLSPLHTLAAALKAMQSGNSTKVDGDFPSETRPLVDNLNQLLTRESEQRQRYRDGLGNLAHSLKTPLAVMHTQLSDIKDPELREQLREQITRMDQVVRRQLQRAVLRHSDSRERSPIKATCERLCQALSKVYRDKNLQFELALHDDLHFCGDSADLMEVLGNLLENACKFSQQKISIGAKKCTVNGKDFTHMVVSDDGCGIAPQVRETILERGQRADSINSGQGIGLSVAAEIVHDYGGELNIGNSPLGGACIEFTLPA